MNGAAIIDGKACANDLRGRVGDWVGELRVTHGLVPGLAVVLVGDDPASAVYVRNKRKATEAAGMYGRVIELPADVDQAEVVATVEALNRDREIHGVLVQLPLPDHIDSTMVIDGVSPQKDVDGLHPINVGQLAAGRQALVPCTPLGCLHLLKGHLGDLAGRESVIVGRSMLVGKPLAQLLLRENATVTVAHSRSRDLPALCRRGEILVVAVGRAEMVRGDWVRPGATVIDVGINRVIREGKPRLVGDVHFGEASAVANAITPVPGGVGPMTIACLLANTLTAACRQFGVTPPEIFAKNP